jgi:hypothetical protein
MESPYWVTKEVLAYFRIARETLRRWRRDLGFPDVVHNEGHPRGPCRFYKAEVLAWEARRRTLSQTRLPDPSNDEGHQRDAAD